MPLSEVFSNRRLRIKLKEEERGADIQLSSSHPAASPSRSTGFPSSLMDPPLSPLIPSHFTSRAPFSAGGPSPTTPLASSMCGSGYSPGSPVVDSGSLSGTSSPVEGHSRLPSTDSGIQADAGWDCGNRCQQSTLSKTSADFPTSPGYRTPLKTLTQCLTEPRAASNRFSRPLSANVTSLTTRSNMMMTSDTSISFRTLSCGSNRKKTGEGTRPRMTSSFLSDTMNTIHIDPVGKAPTTTGEEEDGKRGGSWKRENSILSRSVDSALPTCVLATPMPSIGSGCTSLGKKDPRSEYTGARFDEHEAGAKYKRHSDLIGRYHDSKSEWKGETPAVVGSQSVHLTSRSDHERLGKGVALQSSASLVCKSSSSSTAATMLSAEVRSENTSTVSTNLLSSSTAIIPSQSAVDTRVASQGPGDWAMSSRKQSSSRYRPSSQLHEDNSCWTSLQRFQLTVTRLGSIASSGLQRRWGGFYGGNSQLHQQGNQVSRSDVADHLQQRMTRQSVPALVDSGVGGPSRAHHVQRPVSIADPTSFTETQSGFTTYSNIPISTQTSPYGDAPSTSDNSPRLDSPSSLASPQTCEEMNSLQSSSPAHPLSQCPVTPLPQPDPAHSQLFSIPQLMSSAASGSAAATGHQLSVTSGLSSSFTTSRSRHVMSIFKGKMSPILPGNTLRARIPPSLCLTSSPVSSRRSVPVKHVDTCSACLKTTSISSTTDQPHTAISENFGNTAQTLGFVEDDVKVDLRSTPILPQQRMLKLLEKSLASADRAGGGEMGKRSIPVLEVSREMPWKERRDRMDTALTWLRTELESLRAMDRTLITQFRRCQDSLESLKLQQQDLAWGDTEGSEWSWGLDGSELDEEEEAWEDWEIAEFEKRWAEDQAKELEMSQAPVTQPGTSINNATASDVTVTSPVTSERKRSASPIQQDVEATL